MSYILRRLVFYLVAAWAALTLNFFLPRLMPGDPASAVLAGLQGQGNIRPEQLDAMRAAYGISDAPIWQQYFEYLGNIFTGDFGTSISAFPAPVIEVIGTGLVWTILLGLVALTIAFGLGNLLGIFGAWRRGGRLDNVVPPLALFVGSFPYFWLAFVALFFLGFQLGWFPLGHAYADYLDPGFNPVFVGSVAWHLVLPVATLVVVMIGGWLLGMRNAMIGVLSEDYVTMAEAKGLSQNRVMFRYAARNALLPSVTGFAISLGFVVAGQLFTEIVFSYPGLGYQIYNAVNSLDYPLMQGLFMIITLVVLAANFVMDLLYVRLDPRTRAVA